MWTKIIGTLVGVAVIIALVWYLFMLLWNYVMPIFGLPQLSYWQSAALLAIVGVVGQFFNSTIANRSK